MSIITSYVFDKAVATHYLRNQRNAKSVVWETAAGQPWFSTGGAEFRENVLRRLPSGSQVWDVSSRAVEAGVRITARLRVPYIVADSDLHRIRYFALKAHTLRATWTMADITAALMAVDLTDVESVDDLPDDVHPLIRDVIGRLLELDLLTGMPFINGANAYGTSTLIIRVAK